MKTIKYSAQLLYKDEKKEWPSFVFNILINGESFEYRVGLGHTIISKKEFSWFGRETQLEIKRNYSGIEIVSIIEAGTTVKCGDVRVKIPKIEHVLHCLFSDANCSEQSFENFCSDLGYNTDSTKDLKSYLACQENGKKLRKALKEKYSDIEKQVEALEL